MIRSVGPSELCSEEYQSRLKIVRLRKWLGQVRDGQKAESERAYRQCQSLFAFYRG
jgi:hypothetical protein